MTEQQLYLRQRQQMLQHPLFSWPGLGGWSFYFLLKLLLAATAKIELILVWNLALAVFLVLPVRPVWLKVLRQLVAFGAATALLYTESGLPPFSRLLAQLDLIGSFSGWYLLELLTRFITVEMTVALFIGAVAYRYLAKMLRMTSVTLLLLFAFPLWQRFLQPTELPVVTAAVAATAQPAAGQTLLQGNAPQQVLDRFYAEQSKIKLLPAPDAVADFDILILNVCSLSWDDITYSKLTDHPFLKRADIVLTNYYSGSSYSGPSGIRFLKAGCGHVPHSQLYQSHPECTLGYQLEQLGYRNEFRLNHNGIFGNYLDLIKQYGGLADASLVDNKGFPQAMMGFDGTPIASDIAVLDGWLQKRQREDTLQQGKPEFSFYQTISLHDGNRLQGARGPSFSSYGQRLTMLFDDFNQLFDEIAASKRKVLVVLVPEHGVGIQGDSVQLQGMREIPTPSLTHVPILFKLFGADLPQVQSAQVNQSTGPGEITSIIYQILGQKPFSGGNYNPKTIVENVSETRPVLENERMVMLEVDGQFYLQINNGEWRPYR